MIKLLHRLAAPFSGLPRLVYAMTLAAFVTAVGRMGITFVALYLTNERGLGIAAVGWLVAIAGLGSVLGAYGSGLMSDRLAPGAVLILSLVASFGGFGLLIFAGPPWQIALTLLLIGMAEGSFRPPYNRIVMSVCGQQDRPRAYSLFLAVRNLGFAAAGPIGGILATVDYRLVFATDGVSALLAAGVLTAVFSTLWATPPGTGASTAAVKSQSRKGPRKSPYQDAVFMALCLSVFLSAAVYTQLQATYPAYLDEIYGLSVEQFGRLFLINGLMVAVMQIPLTWLLKQVSNRAAAVVGTLLLCGGFGILPLGSSVEFAVISVVVWTFGEILLYPPLTALVMQRAEHGQSGHYLGIYHSLFSVALLAGPALGGMVYAEWGGAAVWITAAALGLVAASLIAIPEARFARRALQPETSPR